MKKITSLLLAILIVAMSVIGITSCNAGGDLAQVKKNGKLVVGITDYAPMDYKETPEGEWIGFDADLANMFAESLGVECEFVVIDWNLKVGELNGNQIDLIWNGMTASDELGEQIDFSVSYAKNAQVAVVKKGSSITKDTVKTSTVVVENGSAGETAANELGVTDLVETSNGQVGALNEVLANTADVAIIDITMAQSLVGKGEYANLEIVEGASYGDEIFAVGLRQGSDIKAELDAFLKAKYADGTMTKLADKYSVGLNTEALK